jgi:pyruvate-ferredoxin/flavodoxin oxidoreductase
MRVVRRGFDEIIEITEKPIPRFRPAGARKTNLPIMLKRMPASDDPKTDIHRFWEQTGSFYSAAVPTTTLPIPLTPLSLIPANTGSSGT